MCIYLRMNTKKRKEEEKPIENRVSYRITIDITVQKKIGNKEKKRKTDYQYIFIDAYICINKYSTVDKRHKQNPNHIWVLTFDFQSSIHLYHYHKLQLYRVEMFHRSHR
jgi:hypothetical protein